jgi:lipopolysaccharide transport system ATP-binding protein
MSSESGVAVIGEQLSKMYRVYSQPQDRLKEMMFSPFTGHQYGRDFWALRDVSFTLPRGERMGVIGRNGSGKSTLLQILAGTLTPTGGRVTTNGRVAALLELGSGFNPEYTGRENVYINAALLGLTRAQIDERFDAIAAFADIGEFLDQPVKTYSSGMFVRLAFSVVTSVDADVLLIDEALAVGDVFFTQKCYRHLDTLIDRGVSILLVSHDATAVSQFCRSVLVLDHGRLVFQGETVAGIRTYFALQRRDRVPAPTIPASHALQETGVVDDAGISDWPTAEAYLPLDHVRTIGTGARCTALAICDDRGHPCATFEMGQAAVFFFEFELDERIDVPTGGLEIFNERNIVVHGKNSLQHAVPAPLAVAPGERVRFRQCVRLDIAPGAYTCGLGLATIAPEDYRHAAEMPFGVLAGRLRTVIVVPAAGSFAVGFRRDGQALPYHGLCDLKGDMRVQVVEGRDGGPVVERVHD